MLHYKVVFVENTRYFVILSLKVVGIDIKFFSLRHYKTHFKKSFDKDSMYGS